MASPDPRPALEEAQTLLRAGRFEECIARCDALLAAAPSLSVAHVLKGLALTRLSRAEAAIAAFDAALAGNPGDAAALTNRGNALRELGRLDDALASYDAAVAADPKQAEAWRNRGNVLVALRRLPEALESFTRLIALRPNDAPALRDRGIVHQRLKRHREALEDYEHALALDPNIAHAFDGAALTALKACDWSRTETFAPDTAAKAAPFTLLGYSDEPDAHLAAAQRFIAPLASIKPLSARAAVAKPKLRIGYLASEFQQHPTAFLIADLIERHDRARFEVIAFSGGAEDGGEMRARLVRGFGAFHDIRALSDRDAAELIRAQGVDILVDLAGYILDARTAIMAHRPAPVQAQWLGFPGTMGADFIDYVIADSIVLPMAEQPFWSERIVQLPHCYQPNDGSTPIAQDQQSRAQAGLPETGFVFCCFNASWKLRPAVFEVWMLLLRSVEGSVLWLLDDNAEATANLRAEGAKRGVAPERLVFARRLPRAAHLARHALADLFLDTLPYGAHTTGSDALWAGLPLITCQGSSFAGRVGASLLWNVGMFDLITGSMADYEHLALALARDPEWLRSLHARLAANRASAPLFDAARFARSLERAYEQMWEIAVRGEPSRAFAVEP